MSPSDLIGSCPVCRMEPRSMPKDGSDFAALIVIGAIVVMAAIICGSLASQLWQR